MVKPLSYFLQTQYKPNLKKIARFLLGLKEDRKFYAQDRSDRNSMLEMLAQKLKQKIDNEK